MKKKIGILTFHAAHNYGAMLQAYALQTYLKGLGCEVSIVNYRGFSQKKLYPKPYKYWDWAALIGRILHPVLFFKNCKKWNKFEQFLNRYMHLTYLHSSIGETKDIIVTNNFDVVVVGGDQIWNLTLADFYFGYFLPFSLPHCKKVSYAPSMGNLKWNHPNDIDIFIRSTLADFDAISVREKSNIEALQQIVQKEILEMPDPALLLSAEEYNRIGTPRRLIKDDYLFYYNPGDESDEKGAIARYAKEMGLKAVNSNSRYLPIKSFINKNDSGPSEFLNLVRYSNFVIGRSLHLIIFALLYHKPFIILTSDPDTRLLDILSVFDITDRIVSPEQLDSHLSLKEIDWDAVDGRINHLRSKARTFFNTHILDCV